jgi:hypothetical protein
MITSHQHHAHSSKITNHRQWHAGCHTQAHAAAAALQRLGLLVGG